MVPVLACRFGKACVWAALIRFAARDFRGLTAGRSASTSAARSRTPCWHLATGLFTAKVPTTPADQSEGVMAAVARALERAGAAPGDVASFAHGMTVGTNALLEERGARTALIATEGFTDVIELARQTRPELYRLCEARPAPLVPPELRFGVRERNAPRGVVTPLDEAALGRRSTGSPAGRRVGRHQPASLLCAAGHERRVAEAVAERLPGVHVSASHELLTVFREYERTSTTVIDAYLSPLLGGYLHRLAAAQPAPACPSRRSCSRAAG